MSLLPVLLSAVGEVRLLTSLSESAAQNVLEMEVRGAEGLLKPFRMTHVSHEPFLYYRHFSSSNVGGFITLSGVNLGLIDWERCLAPSLCGIEL